MTSGKILFIGMPWKKNFLPYISPFHVKVKLKYEIEKYIVVKNNQQEQFYEMGDYQLQMIPVAAE